MQNSRSIVSLMAATAMFSAMAPSSSRPSNRGGGGPAKPFKTRNKPKKKARRNR